MNRPDWIPKGWKWKEVTPQVWSCQFCQPEHWNRAFTPDNDYRATQYIEFGADGPAKYHKSAMFCSKIECCKVAKGVAYV